MQRKQTDFIFVKKLENAKVYLIDAHLKKIIMSNTVYNRPQKIKHPINESATFICHFFFYVNTNTD